MGVFPRKILMLHGHSQNANILRKRTAAIRRACSDLNVEFVFVDAPHILLPADMPGGAEDLYAVGAGEAAEADADPSLAARAWWSVTDRGRSDGIEQGLLTLRDVLKDDEFEGVFGFSQGASMAAVLCAMLERPHLYPPFLVNGQPPHPPLKFCVAIGGWKPPCPLSDLIFSPSFCTPTLIVLGRNDVIVVEEFSQTLVDVTSNKRMEWHNGGHFVPSTPRWRNFFRNYLADPEGNVPSPSRAILPVPLSAGNATDDLNLELKRFKLIYMSIESRVCW